MDVSAGNATTSRRPIRARENGACEKHASRVPLQELHRYGDPESRLDWSARLLARNAHNSIGFPSRVYSAPELAPERVIVGPPGCGKTHALLTALEVELRSDTSPERVAFVAFTRAARQEAQERVWRTLGVAEKKLPWLRTIHSAAFTLLSLRSSEVVDEEHWTAFGERHGYTFTALEASDPWASARRTPGDILRSAYDWGRNTLTPPDRIAARWAGERVSLGQLGLFARRYEEYKQGEGLLDFSDMLVAVLELDLRPDVDFALIDEAQDLSPLQVLVVSHWFQGVRTVVAGDDDQAVYVFQGANPSWLRSLAERCPTTVLSQSRRVPVRVHALAQRIIRANRDRVPKVYEPDDRPGVVRGVDLDAALDLALERDEVLVLVRNRQFIPKVAQELMRRHAAFLVEGPGGPNPLGNKRLVRATRTASAIGEGKVIAARDLDNLIGFVGAEYVPKGLRERVRRDGEMCRLYEPVALRDELGLGGLLDVAAEGRALSALTRVHSSTRRYVEVLLARHGELPKPRIRVTTIHGAKGRQAGTVLLLASMSRKSYRDYCGAGLGRDQENRVFYVGVTRAREELILVRSRSRRAFQFPSSRKLGGGA